MEAFFQEYGLLVAVAAPVVVIVGLQVVLFFSGERGTLLLPSLRPFESIAMSATEEQPIGATMPEVVVVAGSSEGARKAAANHEAREAA